MPETTMPWAEPAPPSFEALGVRAFTTTRARGSFALHSTVETAHQVVGRWLALAEEIAPHGGRLAFAHQVHGDRVVSHVPGWNGWLRCDAADGHVAHAAGTAMAVTLADCVPVFIAHPRGATAIVHSGWKGTAAHITSKAIHLLTATGLRAADLVVHCGPAICGNCYEVSPDVYQRLTGARVNVATPVDLRALIADHARAAGVREISISHWCTRCHNNRFYSHRAGDEGRQVAVIVAGR
jgi:polyphenol oxidase